MENIVISTRDGLALSARLFSPQLGSVPDDQVIKGGVIINSATGVKQGYYRSFAQFLSQNGYVVFTYDYRGIGDSLTLPYSDSRLTMSAWGQFDFSAVLDEAKRLYPDLLWHCVGHSVGGQIIGLAENNGLLTSAFNVAAQSGNWRFWNSKNQFKLVPTWYVLIPLLSRMLGYFPGSIIGGEHLPKHVAIEWAKWCRNENYICDDQGNPYRPYFHQLTIPMHFLAIDDDHSFAPQAAVEALASFYGKAKVDVSTVTAEERQNRFLGHFGFFRKQHQDLLWSKILNWLETHSHSRHSSKRQSAS